MDQGKTTIQELGMDIPTGNLSPHKSEVYEGMIFMEE